MKVSNTGQLVTHLLRLLVVLLQFVSHTKGVVTYMVSPQNLTSETGKSVSFQCGVSGMSTNERIRFSIIGPKVNATLTCPGQKTTYLPSQSMRAHCETRSSGEVAIWDIAGTSEDDNGTLFLCQVRDLEDRIGFLYVFENAGFYGKLIGYVIGGFLSSLITICVAYILLKRSERIQQCFRSVGGLHDGQTA
ncbi:hypothetical protein IRJ41_005522 [Triplophysa rosa]|uniref:Ig-like domain-containing protein n=1 Tax=Triplophysa rosa TaxID=992332 RepID=A0A9W7WQC2_TRIRA|nr:hypothetical protein IRJ41_005522 [Triplophysa rosa]